MSQDDTGPKIHIDSDWKAEAQAEKERLVQQEAQRKSAASSATSAGAAPGATDAQGLPPASFETLVSTLATQALYALGAFPDPRTGQTVAHLDLARHHIDMLGVLEEITRGNLTDEQTRMLAGTVYELRSRYIRVASATLSKDG